MVYTRELTSEIVEMFDDLLVANGIKVSSPEDDEREDDNEAALYGSVYGELFDRVEAILNDTVHRLECGEKAIYGEWS